MAEQPIRFWIDNAYEKHECYPYDKYVGERRILHDGREIVIFLPDYSPEFDVVHTMERDGLLLILARDHQTISGERLGILLVARRSEDLDVERGETYVVSVLHSLYPWAFKHLGL